MPDSRGQRNPMRVAKLRRVAESEFRHATNRRGCTYHTHVTERSAEIAGQVVDVMRENDWSRPGRGDRVDRKFARSHRCHRGAFEKKKARARGSGDAAEADA